MNVLRDLKEDMNKPLHKAWETVTVKWMIKIVQDIKVKNKITTENPNWSKTGNEKFRSSTKTSEASLTNRVQKIKERISDIEDIIEEKNTSVKENVKS